MFHRPVSIHHSSTGMKSSNKLIKCLYIYIFIFFSLSVHCPPFTTEHNRGLCAVFVFGKQYICIVYYHSRFHATSIRVYANLVISVRKFARWIQLNCFGRIWFGWPWRLLLVDGKLLRSSFSIRFYSSTRAGLVYLHCHKELKSTC